MDRWDWQQKKGNSRNRQTRKTTLAKTISTPHDKDKKCSVIYHLPLHSVATMFYKI